MGKIITKKVTFEIMLELPFWINLRSGKYTFIHYNFLKEALNPEKIKILSHLEDLEEYSLILQNFLWKIGFDHLNKLNSQFPPIYIKENVGQGYVVNENQLKDHFGEHFIKVFHKKMKSVIQKTYTLEIQYDASKHKSPKELIAPFFEPIKQDLLLALNEFLELYQGYFSTKVLNNDSSFVADPIIAMDRTSIDVIVDGEDKTLEIGFPLGFYSHPYYPMNFPQRELGDKFREYAAKGLKPSFAKTLVGYSNHLFLQSDPRLGILYLDMALESCVTDFIQFYNEKNPAPKISPLTKSHTLGNCIKEDLPQVLEVISKLDSQQICTEVSEFHKLRNFIVHRKKKHFKLGEVDRLRDSALLLIDTLEAHMHLPKIRSGDNKKDFQMNSIGIAAEKFTAGYGLMRLFSSFTEMVSDLKKQSDER